MLESVHQAGQNIRICTRSLNRLVGRSCTESFNRLGGILLDHHTLAGSYTTSTSSLNRLGSSQNSRFNDGLSKTGTGTLNNHTRGQATGGDSRIKRGYPLKRVSSQAPQTQQTYLIDLFVYLLFYITFQQPGSYWDWYFTVGGNQCILHCKPPGIGK